MGQIIDFPASQSVVDLDNPVALAKRPSDELLLIRSVQSIEHALLILKRQWIFEADPIMTPPEDRKHDHA